MSPMVKLPLKLEHALLGLLWAQPLHAYELHRSLSQHHALGLIWQMKQSQCYALLGRLEAEGYIASTLEAQTNRPSRKLLRLTDDGRSTFRHWLVEPVAHGRDFRQEFLAKLFFAQQIDAHTLTTLLAAQRSACDRVLAELRVQLAPIAPPFDQLVIQFRIGQMESIRAWLDTCEHMLVSIADDHR